MRRMRAARASAPASRRATGRSPARSSWPTRRRTSARRPDRPVPAASASDSVSKVAASPAASGTGCPASITRTCRVGRRIAVARDREAADPARGQVAIVEIVPLRRLGHRAGALAGGEDDEPAGRRRLRQVRRQAVAGMRGRHRGVEQAFQEGAAWPGHDQRCPCRFGPRAHSGVLGRTFYIPPGLVTRITPNSRPEAGPAAPSESPMRIVRSGEVK